jgi:transposase-like protein
MSKICPHCEEVKSDVEFKNYLDGGDVFVCEDCNNEINDEYSVPAEDDEDCEYSNCSDEEEMESVVCQCGMTHHFKVSDKTVAYACKNCDEWKKTQPQKPCGCLTNEDECCAECAED